MGNPVFKGRPLQALSDGNSSGDVAANVFVGYDYNTCGAGLKALGVCEEPFNSGERVDVRTIGTAIVQVGSAGVTIGAPVAADSDGKAVNAVLGNAINGIALSTQSSGAYVEVILTHGTFYSDSAALQPAATFAAADATLSTGGTVAVTIAGLTTSSLFLISRHTIGGTAGNLTYACTTNTLTLSSSNSSDTSVVTYVQVK